MSALSVEVPSTANAEEHGASVASPSKPSKVYRADYGRLLQEQVNHEKGDAERAEKQMVQMRLDELRESFKQRGRGQMLYKCRSGIAILSQNPTAHCCRAGVDARQAAAARGAKRTPSHAHTLAPFAAAGTDRIFCTRARAHTHTVTRP